MKSPVKELTTGSIFAGRYQIIEELGHGGMGRVYKVQDTKIGEKIALWIRRGFKSPHSAPSLKLAKALPDGI